MFRYGSVPHLEMAMQAPAYMLPVKTPPLWDCPSLEVLTLLLGVSLVKIPNAYTFLYGIAAHSETTMQVPTYGPSLD